MNEWEDESNVSIEFKDSFDSWFLFFYDEQIHSEFNVILFLIVWVVRSGNPN